MTEMKTSEVLHLAADVIQHRGWTHINGEWDESPWGGGSASTAPVCIEGAIGAALGIDMTNGQGTGGDFKACSAYRAVHAYVQDRVRAEYPGIEENFPLFTFNDSVAESAEEVIEVLRAAAEVEALKEAPVLVDEPLPVTW